MSVGTYHSTLTQPATENKISTLRGQQTNLLNSVRERSNLQGELEILKTKEKAFFKILGLDKSPNPIVELRQRIYNLHQINFQNFSGPNLYNYILRSYQEATGSSISDEDLEFQAYLKHYIESECQKKGQLVSDLNLEDYVKNLIHSQFQKTIGAHKNISYMSGRLNSSAGFGQNFDQFFISKMTPTAKKYINKFMGDYKKKLKRQGREKEVIIKNDSSSIQFVGYAEQVETPEAQKRLLTHKEAAEYFSKNTVELDNIWNKVTSYLSSLVPPVAQSGVIETLNNFKLKDKYCIFVGANSSGLAGLVGELETRCVLSVLLEQSSGSKASGAQLQWIANTLVNGKQSSSDFLLKSTLGMLGIQTKNTAQDVFSGRIRNINFTSLTVPNFLKLLGMEGEEGEIINSIYATYIFNIEYQKDVVYQAESNEDFRGTREEIIALKEGMDKIFGYFISELMHLAVKEGSEIQPGNVAFHIGGKGIVMASEILASVITYLNTMAVGGGPFKVTPVLKQGSSMTIVDYLNKTLKSGRKLDKGPQGSIQQYVLNDIILKSSFNFSQLLNNAKSSIGF